MLTAQGAAVSNFLLWIIFCIRSARTAVLAELNCSDSGNKISLEDSLFLLDFLISISDFLSWRLRWYEYWEVSLPKLSCKKAMPRPIAQILFNRKCEGGRDGKKQGRDRKINKTQRERDLICRSGNFCLDAFPRMCCPDFTRPRASPILCLSSGQSPSVILIVFEAIVVSKSLTGGKMIFWGLGFKKNLF